jgi:hypothetical protein
VENVWSILILNQMVHINTVKALLLLLLLLLVVKIVVIAVVVVVIVAVAVVVVVETLCYKPEGRGFETL